MCAYCIFKKENYKLINVFVLTHISKIININHTLILLLQKKKKIHKLKIKQKYFYLWMCYELKLCFCFSFFLNKVLQLRKFVAQCSVNINQIELKILFRRC